MSMKKTRAVQPKAYKDGRTKQSFKDETDINKMLERAQLAGTLSHIEKHGAFYGDFADFDFDEAQFALARATSIFAELPSEVRKEFDQNPGRFFEFVNNPENIDRLPDVLPGLAQPGRQNVSIQRTADVVAAETAATTPPDAQTAETGSQEPSGGDNPAPASSST